MNPQHPTMVTFSWQCLARIMFLFLLSAHPMLADDSVVTLNLIQRAQVNYVNASELEELAGMAVKSLPSQNAVVLCREDRCVLVHKFHREQDQLWIDVDAMTSALGFAMSVDETGGTVSLSLQSTSDAISDRAGELDAELGVGHLAPELHLTRLEGGPITLSELRGKRVLINSWASW